jgi:hypothetical protein
VLGVGVGCCLVFDKNKNAIRFRRNQLASVIVDTSREKRTLTRRRLPLCRLLSALKIKDKDNVTCLRHDRLSSGSSRSTLRFVGIFFFHHTIKKYYRL